MAIEFSHTKGSKNVFYNMQFHSFYEFYFFLGGDAELITNTRKQKLLPNQLVIFHPGTYHNIKVLGNIDTYERCVVWFSPSDFKERLIEKALGDKEVLSLAADDRIVSNFKYLCKAKDLFDSEEFCDILASVITDTVYCIKNLSAEKESTLAPSSSLAIKIAQYIEENFQNEITLDSLARRFNYSVSHLCHTFKEEYGIGIKNYILQKRLNCVHALILGGADIQTSSRKYGFSSYSAFYRIYKKTFLKAPSQFKK